MLRNEFSNIIILHIPHSSKFIPKENLDLLIVCHTFPNEPFKSDLNQNTNRPKFCIGIYANHTTDYLVKRIFLRLTELGYTVKINELYSGSLMPLNFYQKNSKYYYRNK